jgi:hypothetical protein
MPSQRPIPSSRRSRTARPQTRGTRRSPERFNADTTDTRWRRELDADLMAMGRVWQMIRYGAVRMLGEIGRQY